MPRCPSWVAYEPGEAQRAVIRYTRHDVRVTAMTAEPLEGLSAGDPALDVERRGRHRNSALAAWRRDRAVQLATSGRTYQQIADDLRYANRGTVHRIVHQALANREAEDVDFHRRVELTRLDELQVALWPRAMAGHVPSVMACLRILDLRCKLLNLFPDRPSVKTRAVGVCGRAHTVVVHPECLASQCADHAPAQ
jgi:hypothetical protein